VTTRKQQLGFVKVRRGPEEPETTDAEPVEPPGTPV
jgi:hypothetical protein